jgi:HK97 family phage portal protein
MDLVIETTSRVYLKRLALDICINFIGRTISSSEFRVMNNKKSQKNTLFYKLNVRPNTDKSAANFWQDVVYKLIHDNEVLVIKTDTDDLVIADDFERVERALYDDSFKNVTIKDYTYQRTFDMSEVVYMTYNNERLSTFIESLYADYGKLFGQMLDNSMRHNQFRGIFRFKDGGNLTEEAFKRQQKQVEKLRSIFENNSVALAPLTEGIELDDLSAKSAQKDESINNLVKLKRDLVDDVAKMLGIPPNLVHGDVADLDKTMEAYVEFCIVPLMKKISDELNAKFFSRNEYLNGKVIKIIGVNKMNPLKHADAADKLVSSGPYSPNDVLEMFGDERKDDPNMDKHYMTKNYQVLDGTASEGGENE